MAIAIFEPFCGKLYDVTQLATAQWGQGLNFKSPDNTANHNMGVPV